MTSAPDIQPDPTHRVGRGGLAPGSLVDHLASYGARPALLGRDLPGGGLDYAALADRVAEAASCFRAASGAGRRLVLLQGGRDADSLVAYLGALAADQVVLLAGSGALAPLAAAYHPDVVLDRDAVGDLVGALGEARAGTGHDLHPSLALLLSTSGSTGSPKLVRLSRRNLVSNALAIADYLGLRAGDVAPTLLPTEYCYGLSVLHSHLAVGAALLLTEDSVADQRFWDDARRFRATSLAGVPHTFDLLDRVGFAERVTDPAAGLGSLRTLTQAGGRMAPETVRRYAELGQAAGFDLFVMYGQTEATARMAWLPPDLAHTAPGAIGRPVAASSFTLEPVAGDEEGSDPLPEGVGELVFGGPGVMLGYAQSRADLARGREVTALRTGDLGRLRPDGLYEVVGRVSRFAKVFGLRVDLDRCERLLAVEGVVALAADGGDRVVLGVCDGARAVDPAAVRGTAARVLGLPPAAFAVVTFPEVPRLPTGKVDHRAVARLAEPVGAGHPVRAAPPAGGESGDSGALRERIAALYAATLGREVRPTDSFVGLGGDSLTYVEVGVGLERLLGRLPADWPSRPVAALADTSRTAAPGATARSATARGAATRAPRRTPRARLETTVLLRALAILSIVGTHANLWTLLGGAHVLLAVAGFNLARFHLAADTARERARRVLRGAARIAVPSVLVIGTVSLWTDGLGWRQVLLVNALTSRGWSEPAWHYWFVEALVAVLLLVAALVALGPVHRLERRFPFALPVALALLALVTRYDVVPTAGDQIHRAHVVLWLFALGWAAARARHRTHRLLVSALALGTVPGFFGDGAREAYVALGLLALLWLPSVRVPAAVARLAVPVAAASLWTYLVHWQVYPHLEHQVPVLATLLSLIAGHLAWRGWHRGTGALAGRLTRG
jgi:hypothetical protein